MATQFDSNASDNDTIPKPEDDDVNSEDSSTESDSEKGDMNIYITHGKKSEVHWAEEWAEE